MRSNHEKQRQIVYSTEHSLSFPGSSALAVEEPAIPLSIFSTTLSALQALVRYLHDARHYSFSDIARFLGRSPKTIWASYHQAKHIAFSYEEGGLSLPVSRFTNRALAPLEVLVVSLRELGFSNAESARLLRLDPRTTWTAWSRAKKKGVVLQ